MIWNSLSNDIICLIFKHRTSIIIQSQWKCYRVKVLIGRFKMLKYLKDFRIWNPTIQEFIKISKI
jgi:hypothetical protein